MSAPAEPPPEAQSAAQEPPGDEPIRVVLVEDHAALREGLELLLQAQGLEIVAGVGTATEAEEVLSEAGPHVVIVDLQLPDENGAQLCRRLLERDPGLGVVIYSGAEAGELAGALDSGARGYALKAGAPQELVAAIRSVARGGSYVDPRLAPLLLGPVATERAGVLTAREREILAMLADGLTVEQIAERLDRAADTVRTHIQNAMNRLQARTRTHAIAIALQQGELAAASGRGGSSARRA